MGKKTKTGKNRLDKFYRIAKEQGYRSRAAFKLIQLNKKFNFLANSRVLIDLCAAPGSWLQVATKYMPANKVLIGVDLDKIKPIPGASTFVGDITTHACKVQITELTNGAEADCVLHDGAPNVGGAWAQDAFSQSELVLSALKLATSFLKKGGTFVTKIFRSADYNNLLWVFNTLFKKVTATKPQASRATSAEIFVVCEYYQKPKILDPKLLDPKYIFAELKTGAPTVDILSVKKQKLNQEGYQDEDTNRGTLYKECDVLDFIHCVDPIPILSQQYAILFRPCAQLPGVNREVDEQDDKEERELFAQHPHTTPEVLECLKDLKVLNQRDFRNLMKWRLKMRDFALGEPDKEDAEAEPPKEEILTEEEKQNLLQLEMEDSIKRMARLRKRKADKRRRRQQRYSMRMGLNTNMADEEFEAPNDDSQLFSLASIKKDGQLEVFMGAPLSKVNDLKLGEDEEELDIDTANTTDMMDEDFLYLEQRRQKQKDFLYRQKHPELFEVDEVSDEEENGQSGRDKKVEKYLDTMYSRMLEEREKNQIMSRKQRRLRAKAEEQVQSLEDFSKYEKKRPEYADDDYDGGPSTSSSAEEEESDEDRANALVQRHQVSAREKAALWFDDDQFEGLEDEKQEELAVERLLEQNRKLKRKRDEQNGAASEKNENSNPSKVGNDAEPPKKKQKTKEITQTVMDEETYNFEVAPQFDFEDYDSDERAEMLAMGKALKNPKTRSKVLDASISRRAFDDTGADPPTWFIDDELRHNIPQKPVTRQEVQEHKQHLKDIDARSTLKVAEARARKKKKLRSKIEKAKNQAKAISDNSELGSREKVKAIQKLYKGSLKDTKPEKVYVVKGKMASANLAKSKGKNVRIKRVDPRMKKDKRNEKFRANKSKRRH